MTAGQGEERRDTEAPVAEVTLFEDRARVVRRAACDLPAGLVRLRIQGVAPVLADRTLSVAIAPPARGARAVEARATRRLVMRSAAAGPPDSVEALRGERDELDASLARLAASIDLMTRQARAFDEMGALALAEAVEDASWGRGSPEEWTRSLDAIAGREAHVRNRLAALQRRSHEARETRARLEERLASRLHPAHDAWAAIDVDLDVPEPGAYVLHVAYVVPGACWRPYHTACLRDEGPSPRVEMRTDACVWQCTGEAWRDVRLRFSTERPSLGSRPPSLHTDLLRVEKRPEQLAVEAREQEVATLGAGLARQALSRVPGIDDLGEIVSLEAPATCSVASDGRPHRISLHAFSSDAELSLVAIPELVAAALVRTLQTNASGRPLLAGPVDLLRGGGYAGRSSIPYVAAGERFPVGWGPHQDVRVDRDTEATRDKQRMMTSWETRRHRVTVRLSNLGAEPREVKVTERLPVSEIPKVVIEPDPAATTGGRVPDGDGFVTWDVTLPPRGRAKVELRYTLRKHDDVTGI